MSAPPRLPRSEADRQRLIQLEASAQGWLTFRNNCGQYTTRDNHVVRYGVGNPGGSDLIGAVPVTITPDMVGATVAVFAAVEVKNATGRPTKKQLNFIHVVREVGGIGGVCRSPADLLALVRDYVAGLAKRG